MGGSQVVRALVARILFRLEQAESQEIDPHIRDDYRIAWVTVAYAARGNRNPHIAAWYAVLGLHPDKFPAAFDARRRAMLGSCYESFLAEQPPLEQALREWSSQKLPPKKPPQSVRFSDTSAGKKPPQPVRLGDNSVRKKIAAGASPPPAGRGGDARKLAEIGTAQVGARAAEYFDLETPNMASTQVAYPNPRTTNRAKNPAHTPFSRVDQVIVSTAPSHLQNTLRWLLRFNRFGSELWPSTDSIAVAAFKSRRTIQRHLDELVEELYDCQDCTNRQAPSARNCCRRCGSSAIKATGLRVLEMIEQPNDWVRYGGKWTFRHSATYRFHAAALAPRKTYEQFADERAAKRPKRPRCATGAASTAPNAATPALMHPPAPSVEKQPAPKIRLLRSGQASKLVGLVKIYQRGRTHSGAGREGVGRRLASDDPEYRQPMSQHAALVAACEELGYQLEAALEYFKLVPGWKVGDA